MGEDRFPAAFKVGTGKCLSLVQKDPPRVLRLPPALSYSARQLAHRQIHTTAAMIRIGFSCLTPVKA